jgi:hypothetical protein
MVDSKKDELVRFLEERAFKPVLNDVRDEFEGVRRNWV